MSPPSPTPSTSQGCEETLPGSSPGPQALHLATGTHPHFVFTHNWFLIKSDFFSHLCRRPAPFESGKHKSRDRLAGGKSKQSGATQSTYFGEEARADRLLPKDCSQRPSPWNPHLSQSLTRWRSATLVPSTDCLNKFLFSLLPPLCPSFLPTEICAADCGGHGVCVGGTCRCEDGWMGATCDQRACHPRCAEHGTCRDGKCECSPGWNGEHCTIGMAHVPRPFDCAAIYFKASLALHCMWIDAKSPFI